MSDAMELPVTHLGNISEANSMPVLETNPPKPASFILSKREMESVFCHNIKWDLASPIDPPKCLLDGDEIDEKIVSSPSHFSSVEDICLALDDSQETSEIKDQTAELLLSSESSADHVVIAESKESEELVLPVQMDSPAQDINSEIPTVTNITSDECDPCQSKSFPLSKTNDIKQIKGWQEKFPSPQMTQEDDQNNVMNDLPPPLVAIETEGIPLRTDVEKEQSLDSVVDMDTDIFTEENDETNHSTSDSAAVILSSQVEEETLKTELPPVEESQGIEEPMLTTEKSIFSSVEENEKSPSPVLPVSMETEDEETCHVHVEVATTNHAEEKDDQLLAFQMDTESDAEILAMETEAVFSQLIVEAGDEENMENPSPTDTILLVPESVSPSPENGYVKYPDLLEHASTNGEDHSPSIPPEELNFGSSEDDTKEKKKEPEVPMQQQKPDLKELTKRLAEVSHCHEKEAAEINNRACATIEKLKQDSCTLMETYSDLKFENEELLNKMKELDPGQLTNAQQDPSVNIEVMVVQTPTALGCNTLYDQITTGDGLEDHASGEEIVSEEYQEEYGDKVPHNRSLTPQTPNHCKKLPCRGGCICPSLNSDKETAKHCDHPECMLHYNCILPKEIASRPKVIPSIIHPDDKFYQKNDSSSTEADSPPAKRAVANKLRPRGIPAARKNAQKKVPAKSSVKSAGLPRGVKRPLVVLPSVDDHKLKQECFVKIIRLDMDEWLRRKAGQNDSKLVNLPSVRVSRLAPKPNRSIYCMEHQVRGCPCIN